MLTDENGFEAPGELLERRIAFIEDEIENEENADKIAMLVDELRKLKEILNIK